MSVLETIDEQILTVISSENDQKPDTSYNATAAFLSHKDPLKAIFNEFLIQAIDEVLTSLGEPVKNTLYQQLETFKICKEDIPNKLDEFLFLIHKIFGLGGSRLELKFTKNLQAKIKANAYSETDLCLSNWITNEMSFKECLNEMRKCLDQSEKPIQLER
jgi:hypothetical protein